MRCSTQTRFILKEIHLSVPIVKITEYFQKPYVPGGVESTAKNVCSLLQAVSAIS